MLSPRGDYNVDIGSLRQRIGGSQSWPRARLAVWCAVAGAVVTLLTVILSATDAISAQQAIALALPAGMITLIGVIGRTVPDAWTAWRRGFRQGCEAAQRSDPGGLKASERSPRNSESGSEGPNADNLATRGSSAVPVKRGRQRSSEDQP